MIALLSAVLVALASVASAEKYALLVAGSNTWFNYRHQADVCHAYQLMKRNGFKEEHVIVMHYDDIANNSENPFPGTMINYAACMPASGGQVTDECNVYKGCQKDYTGEAVTAENFLKVLQGEEVDCDGKSCNGKTIKSTEDDEVFVAFFDHGGTGLIAFPVGDYLMADDLNNALKSMASAKKFKKLVLYIEACESGSMFNDLLPDNLNIYATTAATPYESSYGCDCAVPGALDGVCLNDCYSNNWMLDVQNHTVSSLFKYTMESNYDTIAAETTMSTVCQYGDLSIAREPFGRFIAFDKSGENEEPVTPVSDDSKYSSSVDSRDIKLHYLTKAYENAKDDVSKAAKLQALNEEIQSRMKMGQFMDALMSNFGMESASVGGAPVPPSPQQCYSQSVADLDFSCYRRMIAAFEGACGRMNDFSIKYTRNLADMCRQGVSPVAVEQFAVNAVCA